MPEPLKDQIIRAVEQASMLYHRLVLLAAPSGAGKTAALQKVSREINAPLINVNLELSKRMLDLTEKQRVLQLPRLLQGIAGSLEGTTVLLDNIEILFDISLKQDPLRLLQGLSRNKTVVVAWNGSIEGEYVNYASPGHPEYKRYSTRDLLVVHQ
ncbi:MAG: BREX-3 system P-loop-containing protein BrxF [Deltaproteobacteria bacterium HGW-Deltaproteobacteria-21]|nr:MAG: BREX-3 system P-loop-containing protein BrxF [Deltaproteobacteria bacterium HGW-Deltaproteobacteria-21]